MLLSNENRTIRQKMEKQGVVQRKARGGRIRRRTTRRRRKKKLNQKRNEKEKENGLKNESSGRERGGERK